MGFLVQASAAPARKYRCEDTRKMVERVLEDVTAISASWLGNAAPIVEDLLAKAESEHVSDADFVQALQKLSVAMPEVFESLDWHVLADALEKVQGTAIYNGAVTRHKEFDVQSQG